MRARSPRKRGWNSRARCRRSRIHGCISCSFRSSTTRTCRSSADVLVAALDDPDGFLRFKALSALEAVVRERPDVIVDRAKLEGQVNRQAMLFFQYLSLRANLRRGDRESDGTLLVRAVEEKIDRIKDRIYRLLGLMYGWKDIAAARWAIERGDARYPSTRTSG